MAETYGTYVDGEWFDIHDYDDDTILFMIPMMILTMRLMMLMMMLMTVGAGTCILPKFPAAAVNIFCANGFKNRPPPLRGARWRCAAPAET